MIHHHAIPMLALAACSGLAGVAPAQNGAGLDRIIIDHSLNRQPVRLVSISEHTINTIDAAGEAHAIPFDDILALAPNQDWTPDAPNRPTVLGRGGISSRPGILELTNGQRLAGAASVVRVDTDSVAWVHPALGIVRSPIDRVSRIIMPRVMPVSQQTQTLAIEDVDVIRLINGDTLRGFIDHIGSDTTIELDAGSTISIPTSSIDQLTLANEPSARTGTTISLRDGSVISIERFAQPDAPNTGRTLCILRSDSFQQPFDTSPASEANTPPEPLGFEIDLDQITTINFDPEQLLPLASIIPTTEGRDIIIDHSAPAILGASTIELPGPMRSTWNLPKGARAIAMTAELPLEARAWGNLDLIISIDSKERQKIHLSASNPQASIRLDSPNAHTLEITLEQGPFGPIQNRVHLRQAVVSVAR